MTATGEFLIAEGAVTTAAILGGIGYLYRQSKLKDEGVWKSLAQLKRIVRQTKTKTARLEVDVGHLVRETPQMKENLAVLASELDSHLRWHERQNREGQGL